MTTSTSWDIENQRQYVFIKAFLYVNFGRGVNFEGRPPLDDIAVDTSKTLDEFLKEVIERYHQIVKELRRREENPIDTTAADNGWNPLTINETMSCTIGDKKYQITRTQ